MAPQKQPGQTGQQPGQTGQAGQAGTAQTHKAALVAAGCPDQTAARIAAKMPAGVSPQHLEQLAQLSPTFNWTLLEQLIGQFGPTIISAVIGLFGLGGGSGPPQPQPAP